MINLVKPPSVLKTLNADGVVMRVWAQVLKIDSKGCAPTYKGCGVGLSGCDEQTQRRSPEKARPANLHAHTTK